MNVSISLDKVWNKYISLHITVKATLWFLICSVIQKSLAFITTPIFTRLLTTEQYGQYSIYNSWLLIFTIITTLRLDYGVFNKGMTKFPKNRDEYVSSMQTTTTIITIIALIIYLIFHKYINQFTELGTLVTLVIFTQLLVTPAINFWILRQRYDFKYRAVVATILLMSFLNVIIGMLAVMTTDNKGLARILSVAIIQIIFGIIFYNINWKNSKKVFDISYVKFGVLFNIPLLPHYFSTYVLEQSDRIMIQKISGIEEVAIYSVAYNVGMVMKIITTSINNSLLPWLYRKLDSKDYKIIGSKVSPLLIFIAVLLLGFIAVAPEFMKLLASEEYYGAIEIIPPVTISVFFIFLFGLFGNVEFYYDKNKFTMYLSFIGAGLNLLLNYFLIPIFGFVVAGYTTLICYIVFTFSHYIFMNRVLKEKGIITLFDNKTIFGVSFVLLFGSAGISLLYNYTKLRGALISIILITMIFNRKQILDAIKELK